MKKNKQKSKSIPKNHCRANKNAFNKIKRPISINKIDIKTIVLSSEHSFGNKGLFKYFIGYTGNVFPIPLCIELNQINGYVKYFDNNNKYINFFVHMIKDY